MGGPPGSSRRSTRRGPWRPSLRAIVAVPNRRTARAPADPSSRVARVRRGSRATKPPDRKLCALRFARPEWAAALRSRGGNAWTGDASEGTDPARDSVSPLDSGRPVAYRTLFFHPASRRGRSACRWVSRTGVGATITDSIRGWTLGHLPSGQLDRVPRAARGRARGTGKGLAQASAVRHHVHIRADGAASPGSSQCRVDRSEVPLHGARRAVPDDRDTAVGGGWARTGFGRLRLASTMGLGHVEVEGATYQRFDVDVLRTAGHCATQASGAARAHYG